MRRFSFEQSWGRTKGGIHDDDKPHTARSKCNLLLTSCYPSRFRFFAAAAATLLCFLIYFIGDNTPPSTPSTPPTLPFPPPLRLQCGLDPSEAYRIEDRGGVFLRPDGSRVTALEIVKEHKYDWIRIRVMVDPNGEYGLFQDLDYVLRMAKDVKGLGFKFLLDLHFSSWWADGDNQWTPLTWRNESGTIEYDDLLKNVYQHTHRVMDVLNQQGLLPDAVQIGNEISAGLLWDHGRLPGNWTKFDELPKEWENVQAILAEGIRAVKDVSKTPKIMIHLDTGGDANYTEAWMKAYFKLGGTADILGLSWYPMWQGTFEDLKTNLDNLSKVFPKLDVWVVETAYYWSGECDKNDEDCKKKFPYPMTEQGQYDFLQDLRKMLLTTSCKAVFYWGSHWTQPKKWFVADESWDDAERRSLFDKTGRVLKGMAGLTDTHNDSV